VADFDRAVLATRLGSAGTALATAAPNLRRRETTLGDAPPRTSAVESRGRRPQEGLSGRRTSGEAPGRAGAHPELRAGRRTAPLADRHAPQDQITRSRVQLHNRLESLLEEAHIKISSVVSDLLGTSARRMLQALADDERDPTTLAALADSRLIFDPVDRGSLKRSNEVRVLNDLTIRRARR
jgi:hypothetical protein